MFNRVTFNVSRLCVRGGNREQSAELITEAKLIAKAEISMSSRHDTKPMLPVVFILLMMSD